MAITKKETFVKGITYEIEDNSKSKYFKLNGIDYDFDGIRVLINRAIGNEADSNEFDNENQMEDLYQEFRVFLVNLYRILVKRMQTKYNR